MSSLLELITSLHRATSVALLSFPNHDGGTGVGLPPPSWASDLSSAGGYSYMSTYGEDACMKGGGVCGMPRPLLGVKAVPGELDVLPGSW